jgi:hypothetical protein
MGNPLITPAGGGYDITDSKRVHASLTLNLSAAPADFSIVFDDTATAVITLEHNGTVLTVGASSNPTIPDRAVTWTDNVAAGRRTIAFDVIDTSADPTPGDMWLLKAWGLLPGAGSHTILPVGSNTVTEVEADPVIVLNPLPPSVQDLDSLPLEALARRNTMAGTAVSGATTCGAPSVFTWSQPVSDTVAAPPAGTSATASGTPFGSPPASGCRVTASVIVPPIPTPTTLHYTFTAVFGDFSNEQSLPVSALRRTRYTMIVFDRSGTMAPTTGVKWTKAKLTAQIWADLLSAFRHQAGTPEKLGVLTFDDPGTGFRSSPGPSSDVAVRWPPSTTSPPAAIDALRSLSDPNLDGFKNAGADTLGGPALQTPVGDALIVALDRMAAASGSQATYMYDLVLLTDGIENVGTVKVDPASPIPGAGSAQLFDTFKSTGTRSFYNFVSGSAGFNARVCTVGIGAAAAVNTTVLNRLGAPAYSPGVLRLVSNENELFGAAPAGGFEEALFSSIGAVQQGVAATPANPDPFPLAAGQAAYFAVPEKEKKLVVVLLWNSASNTLELKWRAQGTSGVFQAPAMTIVKRDTHAIAVVDLTTVSTAGTEWRVAMTLGGVHGAVAAIDVLAARDLFVRTDISFDRDEYTTDQPMVVRAVTFAGARPLRDVRVIVDVEGPALAIGDLLVDNSDAVAPPSDVRRSAGPSGSFDAALARVLAKKKLPALPTVRYAAPFVDGSVELRSERKGGSASLVNTFARNWREGTYRFRFTVSGKTPGGSVFSDVYTRSRVVRLRADDAFSDIAVRHGVAAAPPGVRTARISVTPRDALGQHLGPFHPDDVVFRAAGGTLVGGVQSDFDGSYSQLLVYGADEKPVVTPFVRGQGFTPVLVAPGLFGWLTSLARRASAWLVRRARSR